MAMSADSADKAISTLGLTGSDAAVMKNILTSDKVLKTLGTTREEALQTLSNQITAQLQAEATANALRQAGLQI